MRQIWTMTALIFWVLPMQNSLVSPADDLIDAVSNHDIKKMKEALQNGADPNAFEDEGSDATILMKTAGQGFIEGTRLLIEKGAKINEKQQDGITALMFASFGGYVDVVKLLVEKGADVNAKSKDGGTALLCSFGFGHDADDRTVENIMRILIAKGADVNAKTNNGETALSIAKERHREKIVKLLKAAGAK